MRDRPGVGGYRVSGHSGLRVIHRSDNFSDHGQRPRGGGKFRFLRSVKAFMNIRLKTLAGLCLLLLASGWAQESNDDQVPVVFKTDPPGAQIFKSSGEKVFEIGRGGEKSEKLKKEIYTCTLLSGWTYSDPEIINRKISSFLDE